jgi:hypothetical protein
LPGLDRMNTCPELDPGLRRDDASNALNLVPLATIPKNKADSPILQKLWLPG